MIIDIPISFFKPAHTHTRNMPAKYTNKLQGARVLVLGGSSGIGFCVAEAAVEHGAIVTIASSTQAKLDKAVARLQAHARDVGLSPDTISSIAVDLSKTETLEDNIVNLLKAATKDGKLDHIVHSAGDSLKIKPYSELTIKDFTTSMNVRQISAVFIGKHIVEYVNQSVKSSFTMTSGTVTARPIAGWATLAAKGALSEGLTRGLAVDLKPVRVNIVIPGAVHTELFDFIPKENLDATLQSMAKDSLTGTVGKPEEVAEAYIYSMKDSFATGAEIQSSGGRLIGDMRGDMFGNH